MITHLVGWATDKISLHFWNSKKHFKYNIIPNMRDTNIITKRYNSSPFKRNKRDELSPICIPWCNHRSPSLWCVVLLRFIQYFVIKMHFFQRTIADASYMSNWSLGGQNIKFLKKSHLWKCVCLIFSSFKMHPFKNTNIKFYYVPI